MDFRNFEFFLVKYVPDPIRGEFINIGVILQEVGGTEGAIVRFTRNWSRVLCLDPDADTEMLEELGEDINTEFARGGKPAIALIEGFRQQLSNSIQISEPKASLAENPEGEIQQLMRMYVEPYGTADCAEDEITL
jgi:hypothetical protein